MSTPEANFWNTIRKNLPPKAFATRIENRHGGGVPDCHIVWNGLAFWIEIKVTKTDIVKLSPHQISWNTVYSRRGGINFILVKRTSDRDLFLFGGGQSVDVARDGLRVDPLIRVSGSGLSGSGIGDIFSFIEDNYNTNNNHGHINTDT